MTDPFKDPFADETPQTPAPAPSEAKTPALVADGEGKIVLTLKGGRDFDAPWIVVHASDVDEADRLLTEVFAKELHAKVGKAAKMFTTGPATSGQPSNAPGVPVKSCPHGEMTYKTGNSAKGPWRGYFCPEQDKNKQCSPIWVN